MAKQRVLISAHYLLPGDEAHQYLLESGIETVFAGVREDHTDEDLIEVLQGMDGAIVTSDTFSRRVLESTDRLKVIARTGVGYDTVDMEVATARGVVVCTNPGVNRRAVAEYTFALMLLCARKPLENVVGVRRGEWTRYEGTDLAGKTLGIVGLGAIGREVARRARAFEMRLLAHSRTHDQQFAEAYQVGYVPLEQLLRESDFVSIHISLNAGTRHLIDAERLAMMKPTAYLINTARGAIVDSEALAEALKQNRIAGAALDVLEQEPLGADSPLRGLDNVYLSPHVAGSTGDVRRVAARLAAENAVRVLRGDRPHHVVNPEVLEKGAPRWTSDS